MESCRFLLRLCVAAFLLAVLVSGCASASSSTRTEPAPTASVDFHPCTTPSALYNAGLLSAAKAQYSALLTPPRGKSVPPCAVAGLQTVAKAQQNADWWTAQGDRQAAAGNVNAARTDYRQALDIDHGDQTALAGLKKLNEQAPNDIRQARDYWNQIVTNTLVPLGQFVVWLAAVGVAIYILYLLTRVLSRWLPLPEKPSRRSTLKTCAIAAFVVAGVLAGLAAAVGVAHWAPCRWPVGDLWGGLLIGAGVLALAGCSLVAWYLRSGSGVHFTVTSQVGSSDDAGRAFLAGRLDSLGAKPPRGFDLPQDTDVTSLSGVITLLPGGGMLSALVSLLLVRLPATPWQATVTLIDDDQLLVTLHRNGRPVQTVLANRASLFFPSLVAGQGMVSASSYVKAIDQRGMLTVAAAIILVTMAMTDPDSPLRTGLNGATRWESVAGQVLATAPGFSGNEGLSQALLDRAVDIDPGNLAAQVAKIVLSGRRAADPASRRDFAEKISEIARLKLRDPGYEVLRLRALYSSAAGWCNEYLDSQRDQDWRQACDYTAGFVFCLCGMTSENRAADNNLEHPGDAMTTYMKAAAYIFWTSLRKAKPAAARLARVDTIVAPWRPTDARTARGAYDQGCLASQGGRYGEALRFLKLAAVDEGLRIWARRDPSFVKVRAHAAQKFLDIVADPPPDSFASLGPMSSHAGPLSDVGIHTAADLRVMTSTDAGRQLFAEAIGVPRLVVERWRNIAILGTLSPGGPDLGQLDLLVTAGVDSLKQLCAQTATQAGVDKLHEKLAAASPDHQVTVPDQNALERWAQLAAKPHSTTESHQSFWRLHRVRGR
jgi:hypothetical protein